MTKVLLVDDDLELTAMLSEDLMREGFDVSTVHDGQLAVCEAMTGRHDIVVLDVMMPRMSGMEALRRIRSSKQVPILMLTARGDIWIASWDWTWAQTTMCPSPVPHQNWSHACVPSCAAANDVAPGRSHRRMGQ
jgi:DNA-binding NtrC family response regulator